MDKAKREERLAYYMQRTWNTQEFVDYITDDDDFHNFVEELISKVLNDRGFPKEATPQNVDWKLKIKNRFSFMYWAQRALQDSQFHQLEKEFETENELETFKRACMAYIKSKRPYQLRLENIAQTMDVRIQMLQSPDEWRRQYLSDEELVPLLDNEMERTRELLVRDLDLTSLSTAIEEDLISDDVLAQIEERVYENTADDILKHSVVISKFKSMDMYKEEESDAEKEEKKHLYRTFIHFLFQRVNRTNDEIRIRVGYTKDFNTAEKWVPKIRSSLSTSGIYRIYTEDETKRPLSLMRWLLDVYLPLHIVRVTEVNVEHISIDDLAEQFSEEIASLVILEG